jgi:hypothetical protein
MVKVKFTLEQATKAQRGRCIAILFPSTSTLDGGGWSTPCPGRFTPGNDLVPIGGWVGPRVGLDGCGKSRPSLGFDPRTVQPVASRYNRLRYIGQ